MAMYGPQSSDLANAMLADRNRHAAQLALERSARRSRPTRARVATSGQTLPASFQAAFASARALLLRPRPSPSIQ